MRKRIALLPPPLPPLLPPLLQLPLPRPQTATPALQLLPRIKQWQQLRQHGVAACSGAL
jgi:hypothetical protein